MQKEECIEIFERYLQNRTNDYEVKRLSRWIQNNQEISLWLEQQISTSSSLIDREVQMRMLKNIEAEIYSNTKNNVISDKQSNIRFRPKKWLRVAALFILPMLTAAGMYFYMSKNEFSSAPLIIAVERGQKANVTLPDGSKVWLNSQSKLTYSANFNKVKRELELDGEAYFEVAHNPQKPFIVKSNDIVVEALGTAFGMKAYNEDNLISSILMRGKVRVTTPDGESILMPNERVMYDKTTHKKALSAVTNATDFTGWIHNELRFENESLGEIAKTIQRIYNVEIIFATEQLKNQHYTGTVNNNSLESVLNIITLTSPVSFQIDKQQVTLFENKKLMEHYNP
ncbi:MAG: FecR domain-containing protein [Paludibacter sp.]|jgi:ferric-dicitrate binding protein FerR (iron transport regulator)